MTEKTFLKIMNGYMVVLAVIMFLLITTFCVYHLLAGHFNLFTLAAFGAIWYITFKFVHWSVDDFKKDASNS